MFTEEQVYEQFTHVNINIKLFLPVCILFVNVKGSSVEVMFKKHRPQIKLRNIHEKYDENTNNNNNNNDGYDVAHIMKMELQIREELYLLSDEWINSEYTTDDDFLNACLSNIMKGYQNEGEKVLIVCENNHHLLSVFNSIRINKLPEMNVNTVKDVHLSMKKICIYFISMYETNVVECPEKSFDYVIVMLDYLLYGNHNRQWFLDVLSPVILKEPYNGRKLWIKCFDKIGRKNNNVF